MPTKNLHASGVSVVVGLRKDSASWQKAERAGLKVAEVPDAAKAAEFLTLDEPGGTFNFTAALNKRAPSK